MNSIRFRLGELGRDHVAGALCSANVPRPAASSFISLRRAHHRRDLVSWCLNGDHRTACPVPRALGRLRNEIKEEAQPEDIRGGDCPVFSALAPAIHPEFQT